MLIYKHPYFQNYNNLSIAIFNKTRYAYSEEHPYKNHPLWKTYIELLRSAGVTCLWICRGRSIGITYQEYSDVIGIKNDADEISKIESRHIIVEKILIQ